MYTAALFTLRDGGLGRTLSVTADNRTFAHANADGFTVFDVASCAERVKTDPLSAVEPDRKLRTLMGTSLRADGSRLAALVLFPTRLITTENRFPVMEDYRDHLWLVVFDTVSGKRVSAVKLQNPNWRESSFDQLSWWGGGDTSSFRGPRIPSARGGRSVGSPN